MCLTERERVCRLTQVLVINWSVCPCVDGGGLTSCSSGGNCMGNTGVSPRLQVYLKQQLELQAKTSELTG